MRFFDYLDFASTSCHQHCNSTSHKDATGSGWKSPLALHASQPDKEGFPVQTLAERRGPLPGTTACQPTYKTHTKELVPLEMFFCTSESRMRFTRDNLNNICYAVSIADAFHHRGLEMSTPLLSLVAPGLGSDHFGKLEVL